MLILDGLNLSKFFQPIKTDEEIEEEQKKGIEKPVEEVTPQRAAIEVMKVLRMHFITAVLNIVAIFLVFGNIEILGVNLSLGVLVVAVFWNGLQLARCRSYYESLERKYLKAGNYGKR